MSNVGTEKEEDAFPVSQSSPPTTLNAITCKSRTCIHPAKSVHRTQIQVPNNLDDTIINSIQNRYDHEFSSSSTSSSRPRPQEIQKYPKKASFNDSADENGETTEANKVLLKGISFSEGKVFRNPEMVVTDCWRSTSGEVKLVSLLKEASLEENPNLQKQKRKLDMSEDNQISPPYTKEFHLLTEVQKARILTAVEDAIKKLTNEDYFHHVGYGQAERPNLGVPNQNSIERFICKKFLLPWVIMKVVEMVLCHVIQLTFLSDESYFQRKNEFLPIVVTYYLTLFIVVISLIVHISCFTYAGIQNPCYFMGVISSSILTLTTTFGILIMLTSLEYYKSFREILVLVFVGVLLCSLFAELCLCYIHVKTIWNRVGQADQYYTA